MSLLGDIRNQPRQADHARVLIHGQPGTGKTTLAGTIAETGLTLYLYVKGEEGIGSLYGTDHDENLVIHQLSGIPEMELLYYELLKGDHDYNAVVLDSVSALQTMWKKYLLRLPMDAPAKERPATDFAFWGSLADGFTDLFTFWYGLASHTAKKPIHVVMTSQTKAIDDAAGDSKMQPDLHKGPLAPAVSRSDQILYTHMMDDPDDWDSQKHVVRVKPSSSIVAKTRCSPAVADKIPSVMGVQNRVTLLKYLSVLGVAGV